MPNSRPHSMGVNEEFSKLEYAGMMTNPIPASAAANGYTQDIDSFTTLDLKYTFDLEWGESMITLSAGVNNATDEEAPQVYDAANFSYDAKHHDPRGVMSYLGFKITL